MAIVTVDVDLNEISDGDLITELSARKYTVSATQNYPNAIERIVDFISSQLPEISYLDMLELENYIKSITKNIVVKK